MKKYLVQYANNTTGVLSAKNLLDAQKAAHKEAAKLHTIVIRVTEQ
jgi:hypothetical protein